MMDIRELARLLGDLRPASDSPYSRRPAPKPATPTIGPMATAPVGFEGVREPTAIEAVGIPVAEMVARMNPAVDLPFSIREFLQAAKKGDKTGMGLASLAAIPMVGPAGKGVRAIKNLRHLSHDDALAAARLGQHLIQAKKTGQFVGAPRGVTSMDQIEELRRNFDAMLDESAGHGAGFSDWYARTQEGIRRVAGRDVPKRRRMAGELAVTSPQADPETNLGFALKAHNAIAAGRPAKIVRIGATAKKIREAAESGEDIKQGLKTDPFMRNMVPVEDRTLEDLDRTVNDIWHLRNWGFRNKKGNPWNAGATPQMHSFVDAETRLATDRANARRLGGKDDWTQAEIQALPWIIAKAKGLQKRYPKRHGGFEGYLEEASKSYPDFFNKHTASATFESIPGRGVGHREDLLDAPRSMREEFAKRPAVQWSGPDQRDVLYDALGMYQQPTRKATGFFRPPGGGSLEINPAKAARPMVDFAKGNVGVSRESRGLLNAAEHLRAYMDAQQAGAWHVSLPGGKKGNTLFVPLGRSATPTEIRKLADLFEPRGFGLSDTGGGITISPVFGNADIAPKDARALGMQLKKGWDAEIRKILPDAREVHRVRIDGNYLGTGLNESRGKGKATRALLRTLKSKDAPAAFEALSKSGDVRQMAQQRLEMALADQAAGATVRPDLLNALKAISSGGAKGLERALKAGVSLPVLAALMASPDGEK